MTEMSTGGRADLEHLVKVEMDVHLMILNQ